MTTFKIISLILGAFFSLLSFASSTAEQTIEWAPFVKKSQVCEQQLLAAAQQVHSVFLSVQPGFIKRVLVKKSEQEFADVVYWKTLSDAQSAADKVRVCKVCLTYFSLMDTQLTKEMESGFAYFKVLKKW